MIPVGSLSHRYELTTLIIIHKVTALRYYARFWLQGSAKARLMPDQSNRLQCMTHMKKATLKLIKLKTTLHSRLLGTDTHIALSICSIRQVYIYIYIDYTTHLSIWLKLAHGYPDWKLAFES